MSNPINNIIISRTVAKASKSPSKYKVGAIAVDYKGNVLGIAHNTYSTLGPNNSNKYMGFHAERRLMERYKSNIKSIIILRVGKSGKFLPITPCKECSERAKELGIKIVWLTEENHLVK